MSFAHALYQLLIRPLELIFEVAYGVAIGLTDNHGLSIFVLSLTVNVLLLPLYRRADAIQDEERQIGQRLAPWVKHIKKTFSGDERYMILQTYYRQNNYKPYYALRGMMPLVLEIPFFIAAYRFLSNLEALQGTPFGPIRDLGTPDGLLTLGGVTVHLLPIVMTLINGISSAIYTKGLPAKDKLQLYGMALVFLVLLYGSPSGLVLYWTLNNLFSLFKNLFYKLKDPRKVLRISLAVLGAALGVFACLFFAGGLKHRAFLLGLALLMELPILWRWLGGRGALPTLRIPEEKSPRLFFAGAALLTVLTGVLIPSSVVASSPSEFVLVIAYRSPLWHLADSFLLAAGFFVVWLGLFYFLADGRGKRVISLLLWLMSGIGLLDYMVFGTNSDLLSMLLRFDDFPGFPLRARLVNLLAVAVLAALMLLVWRKKRSLTRGVYLVLTLALVGMSGLNVYRIEQELPAVRKTVEIAQAQEQATIPLSREGKNVVVLMIDRALSPYIPYFFREKPELEQQYAGFTYYPNTVSFGSNTHTGSPSLFGGYEYTPEAINARDSERLVEKHNESLRVMPVLFGEAGYEVTVCDPSYAGYQWIPDLSIYKDLPYVRAFWTENDQFVYDPEEFLTGPLNRIWERNFFCYSVMKISPLFLQPHLYHQGNYFAAADDTKIVEEMSYARSLGDQFTASYAVLNALPDITRVSDGDENTFLLLCNLTAHSPRILQEPEYEPELLADNRDYDAQHRDRFTLDGRTMRVETVKHMAHYQVNMAAILQLGRWFDYLRENGVYDNTRIIVVADHGHNLHQFDDLIVALEEELDIMQYNPLLMVKDFGSTDFKTDGRFMTNADTPVLAMEGLIADPVNPFTGKPISSEAKNGAELHILASTDPNATDNHGNTFQPDPWFAVHDDIFDLDNWSYLGVK